jgi:hypothetical protein
MSSHPIEGVNYLLDRYAYLDLPRDATLKQIRAVIRAKRAANHPDRLQGAGPEILRTAENVRELADKCAAILLDADLRAAYDQKLAEFKRERPNSITASAVIPMDLNEASWDLDALLESEDAASTEPDHLDVAIAAMSGYNPKQHALLEKMFAASPDDEDARAMVREARAQALIMATLVADFAWRKVGYNPGRTLDPHNTADPYAERERLAHRIDDLVQTGVPEAVGVRHQASALRLAAPLKLLGVDGATDDHPLSDAAGDAQVMAQITERAQAALRLRTERIHQATAERTKALEGVLELTPHMCLGNVAGSTTTLDLALALNDLSQDRTEVAVVFRRHRDGSLRESPLDAAIKIFAQENGFNLGGNYARMDAWRAFAAAGHLDESGVVLVEHHPEVKPVLAEIWWAARQPRLFVPTWTDENDAVDEGAANLAADGKHKDKKSNPST